MIEENEIMVQQVPEEEVVVQQTPEEKAVAVQSTKEQIERDRRLEELNRHRVTTKTELPPVNAILSVDGVPVIERGSIIAVKAKQKQGKTSVLKTMVAAWMKGELFRLKSEVVEARILWLDTEQNEVDVKQIIDDIRQMTGMDDKYIDSHLKLYTVRTLSFKTLLKDTELLISQYRPDAVVIDGLVDYLESFNDESQSHTLVNALIRISAQCQCAVINVLHENKGSDDQNMRGHLGTILSQKANMVIRCGKDNSTGVITAGCSDSRHRAMPDWKIKYDEYGHIVSAEGNQPTKAQQKRQAQIDILKGIIQENGGEVKRSELALKGEQPLGLSRPRVSNLITELIKDNVLCEVDDKVKVAPEPAPTSTPTPTPEEEGLPLFVSHAAI